MKCELDDVDQSGETNRFKSDQVVFSVLLKL